MSAVSGQLGILGVGEAGGAIASGLHEQTGQTVVGFDLRHEDPDFRRRAAAQGVELCGSLEELAARCDVLLALTSAKVAVETAAAAAAQLGPDNTYVDLNSASPMTMQEVAAAIAPSGARFADGAVMAAVPAKRNRVPILVSGADAAEVAAQLSARHLNVEAVGEEPGQASAIKMLRSSILKGVDSLVLECLQAAAAYGVADRVLTSINGSMHFDDWRKLADYVLSRETKHGARRAEELRQAAATIRAAGVEPLLAEAGSRRIQHFVDSSFASQIADAPREGDLVDAFLSVLVGAVA